MDPFLLLLRRGAKGAKYGLRVRPKCSLTLDLSSRSALEAVQAFLDLEDKIPAIEHIEWGVNDSKEGASKGMTHTFTLTFKDDHGREVYLFHEAHIALVNKIGPIIGDVLVMDYWTAE